MKNLLIIIVLLMAILNGFGQNTKKLDKIFKGPKISITIKSSGCFHHTEEVLIIEITPNKSTLTNPKNKKDKQLLSSTISEEDLKDLRQILNKGLKLDNEGYCTTTTHYSIDNGSEKVGFWDKGCKFNLLDNWLSKMCGNE